MTQSTGSRRRDHPRRRHGLESIAVQYPVQPVHDASLRHRDGDVEGKVERHLFYLIILS
jgi:hypothetical protein